ncbi:hypothetical protein U8V72_23200 [Priestia filamentosa]|uniref:hypothetical protein n=1 Tax=Priestia filamentosa TaxID=1402861 RepID=UPI0005894E04
MKRDSIIKDLNKSWRKHLETNKFSPLITSSSIYKVLTNLNVIDLVIHEDGRVINVMSKGNIPLAKYRVSYNKFAWHISDRQLDVNKSIAEPHSVFTLINEFPWMQWCAKLEKC